MNQTPPFIHGSAVLEKPGRQVAFWPAMDSDGSRALGCGHREGMGADTDANEQQWYPCRVNEWELPVLNSHLQHSRRLAEKPSVSSFLGRDDEQASGSMPSPVAQQHSETHLQQG